MDGKDVEAFAYRIEQNTELISTSYADALTQYVERFVHGEESGSFHLAHDIKIDDVARALGLDDLKGKQVVAQYLCNKVSAYTREYFTPHTIHEPISIEGMLNRVADMGMSDDYPNDFYAGFAIRIDDDTCAAFYLDHEEEVGICASCSDAGYDDAYHGCGHDEPDTYTHKYWFMLCRPDQVQAIIWERGEVS